jgi:hypothetical protein
MCRQEQEGEARQWHEEAGWLATDEAYLVWLASFGPWWHLVDSDEKYIQEQSCLPEQ